MKGGSHKHSQPSSSDAQMKQARLCRFLRVFFFFIIFVGFTFTIFLQASDSHFIEEATNYFNLTSTADLIGDVPDRINGLKETLLHIQEHQLFSPIFNAASGIIGTEGLDGEVEKVWNQATELLENTEETLNWLAAVPPEDSKAVFRFDTVAYNEVHILHKLTAVLKKFLKNKTPETAMKLADLANNGYQCSGVQASQQEVIAKFIKMDICSEIEWYKVVHLAWPSARTFIDVGGNKGYLGSLFLTLWGGNGFQLAPIDVLSAATRLESWKDSRNPAGYCQDGHSRGIPLYCPADQRDRRTGKCNMANADVRVTSFDGSSYLAGALNQIIRQETPIRQMTGPVRDGTVWKYLNYAVSDVDGVAHFTKQSKEKNAGFEGGSIRSKTATAGRRLREETRPGQTRRRQLAELETEEVNMTTIDSYLRLRGAGGRVDVMKIDTEGQDNKVLTGAAQTIESAGMFTFEGGRGVTFSKEMIEGYDKMGFSCYSTSRAGLFKWNAGCMKEQYMGPFRAKDKGNIFCVSRKRAPMATLAYDILSFPMMIEEYLEAQEEAGNTDEGFVKFQETMTDESKVGTADGGMLVPIYLNIKPFCTPFPQCIKV